MATSYKNVNNLKVAEDLLSFVNDELLKDIDISPEKFWSGLDKISHELAPKNKKLIEIRENLYQSVLSSPLFDTKKFSKNFNNTLLQIYKETN